MKFEPTIELLLNRLARFMEEMADGKHHGGEWEASSLMDSVSSFGYRASDVVSACKERCPEIEQMISSILIDIEVMEKNVSEGIARAKASPTPARELINMISDAEKLGDQRTAFRIAVELLDLEKPSFSEILRDIENGGASLRLGSIWALAGLMTAVPSESQHQSHQQGMLLRLIARKEEALVFYNASIRAKPLYRGDPAAKPPKYLLRVGKS